MKLRSEVRSKQQQRAQIINQNPDNYLLTLEFKRFSRDLTQLNTKISRLNDEIARQVAHKIIDIAKAYKGTIKFENLKWSHHSKKRDRGFWLAYWQQHWFFSKIIDTTASLAKREGISVELIDPRYTSKQCWKDPKHQGAVRSGKIFSCPSHKYKLDSDLNAARNIALRATMRVL